MAYTDKLRVVYGDYTLGVHGEGFDYIFSYAQGGLESIVKNGYEWLYRCPKPTFWRALTDNDRGSKFHIKSGSWLSADMFIDCKGIQVIMDGKEQKQYAPDNNSYGGDVYADEITRHTALDNSRTDSSSQTLRIEKNDEKFAFSCLPYTASEIENALHHEELPPARRTVLCIYGAVRGVGGIDSWGTDVEEDYRISAETDKDYSFTIC
ncbi:hypothetical protein [Agathobacter rectalis]|uniref:hypothetical protein n=1 Tax=Agathobacter rectalis TaxID=39491 RepID=UPI0027FCA02B|nr:hypothetical protein [Agathobacter rectalis]